jgi:hypothetical protein
MSACCCVQHSLLNFLSSSISSVRIIFPPISVYRVLQAAANSLRRSLATALGMHPMHVRDDGTIEEKLLDAAPYFGDIDRRPRLHHDLCSACTAEPGEGCVALSSSSQARQLGLYGSPQGILATSDDDQSTVQFQQNSAFVPRMRCTEHRAGTAPWTEPLELSDAHVCGEGYDTKLIEGAAGAVAAVGVLEAALVAAKANSDSAAEVLRSIRGELEVRFSRPSVIVSCSPGVYVCVWSCFKDVSRMLHGCFKDGLFQGRDGWGSRFGQDG